MQGAVPLTVENVLQSRLETTAGTAVAGAFQYSDVLVKYGLDTVQRAMQFQAHQTPVVSPEHLLPLSLPSGDPLYRRTKALSVVPSVFISMRAPGS